MLSSWIFALIVSMSPPARATTEHAFPGWAETPFAREARYRDIAEDIAAVTTIRSDAATLVAIAWMESGFAPDVDAGRCYRGKNGRGPRCDGGRAHGIYQLHATGKEQVASFADRRVLTAEALRRIRRSRGACGGGDHGLEIYAAGRCGDAASPAIFAASKARIDLARRLMVTP